MARKTKADRIAEAKIQGAIYGLQIPMRIIPALYKAMLDAVVAGKTGAELRAVAANYPGVTEA